MKTDPKDDIDRLLQYAPRFLEQVGAGEKAAHPVAGMQQFQGDDAAEGAVRRAEDFAERAAPDPLVNRESTEALGDR